MTNPWLDIPLADYEAHMALPDVAQAQLLADVFESLLEVHRPASVAVIGCAGGNGFDRIDPTTTSRVVGVDLNAQYLDVARGRYRSSITDLELIAGDIQSDRVRFAPVELIYAALVLEYVDVKRTLERVRALLAPGGMLATVVQLPGAATVTPSPFTSLEALAPIMRLVDPGQLERVGRDAGYREIERRCESSRGGKRFEVQVFQLENRGGSS